MEVGRANNQAGHFPRRLSSFCRTRTKQQNGHQGLEQGVGRGVVDAFAVRQLCIGMNGRATRVMAVAADLVVKVIAPVDTLALVIRRVACIKI